MGKSLLILAFVILIAIFFFLGYFIRGFASKSEVESLKAQITNLQDVNSQFNNQSLNFNQTNKNIGVCNVDSDCIVVPFNSCCGSTKRAINKVYLAEYNSNPELQKFDDPEVCALIGICANDQNITQIECKEYSSSQKRCSLIFN